MIDDVFRTVPNLLRLRQALALPIYAVALILDYATAALCAGRGPTASP